MASPLTEALDRRALGPVRVRPDPALPRPRGPVTERLFSGLSGDPGPRRWLPDLSSVDDDDLQLALYCCYELHYRGLPGVDAEWEWEPSLLGARAALERRFEQELREAIEPTDVRTDELVPRLWQLAAGGGPSLSDWTERHATLSHLRELAIHRSAYQLKEADPHTWAIPRLDGAAKAAMVAIQFDEYGMGSARRMHSSLFSTTLRALGLSDDDGAYLDDLPAETLATTNLISLFGLHRRWRGALVGHLALFEMTSIGPMARYARALRRTGVSPAGCEFYDVHVEADTVHQHVASEGMVGGLLAAHPELADDVLFGASALSLVESRFAARLLRCWREGRTSLYEGAEAAVA